MRRTSTAKRFNPPVVRALEVQDRLVGSNQGACVAVSFLASEQNREARPLTTPGMKFEESVELAASFPDALPPFVVDIDGTLTDDDRAIDPRVFPVLRGWPAPVVVATGKAMPYPVGLCEFLGIEPLVIAENGGVVVNGRESVLFEGDREAAAAAIDAYEAAGYATGWGGADLVNRWRETELAISRDSPLEPLERIAAEYGLEVVDTGYAYHVKSPGFTKGTGLTRLAGEREFDPGSVVAIGDSVNDVPAFELAHLGVAVANADTAALAAADHVTTAEFGDGFLEAVEWVCDRIDAGGSAD